MQSSTYLATWKSPEFHLFPTRKPFSKNLKPLPSTPPNSLTTPTGETLHENGQILLPVVVKESGRVSRYAWDGKSLELVSLEARRPLFLNLDVGLAIRDFFIPKRVPENYMSYVKWKFLHRVFSSALQVLATQAMFRAIGIGYSRSLPSAAALNWVLKDGLGRLSRCIYTASFASAFDTNLKRVRFSTSVLFSLTIGVELLTPAFPQYFLLLATLANAAKQISLACYLATSSAIHRSFAIEDNLGEVSAKAQIQSVCFDNLGLMLATFLNLLLKNNQRLIAGLPFVVYPIFSAIDLYGIYRGLKHVHLQTLTKDRLEIILNIWIEYGRVPSPAEASRQEGINFLWSNGKELWPIRIGSFNTTGQIPKFSAIAMQSLRSQDYHFVCLENYKGLIRAKQQGILLCLREGAGIADVMMGLLQACYIRKALCFSRWDTAVEPCDASKLVLDEWFELIVDTKHCAERDMPLVLKEMSAQGWAVKNILLSKKEQSRYSFVDD